jgi:hypothetical protein
LQFKVIVNDSIGYSDKEKYLIELLGTNHIIDLELNCSLHKELPNSIYQTLRSFKYYDTSFNNHSKFEKLQILGFEVALEQLKFVIPFLASKFSQDRFQRMQINLFADDD